jgi:ABC-type thiamin/hydroxymethylpyrimidine transport system permease subunit
VNVKVARIDLGKWFDFENRDLVLIATLVAVAGVFQYLWAQMVFDFQWLGPWRQFFSSWGFNVWSFLAVFLVRKRGAGTIVKTLAAVIELALGNPVGAIVIFYGFAEGFAADLAYAIFQGRITLNTIIVGALLAHFITLPYDAWNDAIKFGWTPMLTYTGPAIIGKVWTSWLVFLTLRLINQSGILPTRMRAVDLGDPSIEL